MMAGHRALSLPLALGVLLAGAAAQAQPPGGGPPIDPRQMSGLGRVDPQVPPGSVTVRCLLGGFDAPAIGAKVQLEARSADGSKVERFEAVAGDDGRATFSGLEGFLGGTAVATAVLGGEEHRSQAIPLAPSAGSRVMLVQGAGASQAGAAGGPDGSSTDDVPGPGRAFPDERFPAGTVVVGALDLGARAGVADAEVTVLVTTPEGGSLTRSGRTDAQGRALFPGLLPPEVPEGSEVVVEALLGGEKRRSEPFGLGDKGMIVVLTIGEASEAPVAGPAPRRPVMPPRMMPTIPAGTVRLAVIDGRDRPVAGQAVTVLLRDVTGGQQEFAGTTGPDGVALVEVEVADGGYEVRLVHQGAPFRSRMFQMGDAMGVGLEMRVFSTTSDLSRVRTATQFEVIGRENDMVQVGQLYQVFVAGEEAFWPGKALQIPGAEGATGFVVMDRAADVLDHPDKAPFAMLVEPIPPGEVVDLSVAYLLEHDGSAEVTWTPPLPLVDGSVLVGKELKVMAGAKGPPTAPPQAPQAPFDLYEVGGRAVGEALTFTVDGLPVRPRLIRDLGWQIGLGLAVVFVVLVWPRRGAREQLEARKAALLAELDRLDAAPVDDPSVRSSVIAELDRIFRQLEALAPTKPGKS